MRQNNTHRPSNPHCRCLRLFWIGALLPFELVELPRHFPFFGLPYRFFWRRKVGVPWLEVYSFTSSSLKRVSLCQTFVSKTPVKNAGWLCIFFDGLVLDVNWTFSNIFQRPIKPSQPLPSSSNLISWAHVVQLSDNRTTVKIRGL